VTLWARRPAVAAAIREQRTQPGLPAGAAAAGRRHGHRAPAAAIHGAELVVLAVPSQTLRGNLADWAVAIEPDATLVSLMKGIELGTPSG
jgi:glycerol-3-phosphate dehydrogenase (NAD(P)+)